jgi:hypothetical protein
MGGGGGTEEELTAQETALYDRQIRVWGVDAQKRCPLSPTSCFFFLCYYGYGFPLIMIPV